MKFKSILTAATALAVYAGLAYTHGDVNPQPVDVAGLPSLDDWGTENPYRDKDGETHDRIIRTGERGYGQNCAACHGLGGVSGGIAPDLRLLEPGLDDEYFVSVVRKGARGMPSFDAVLEPEAIWAIKTWLETMHDAAMEERYGS